MASNIFDLDMTEEEIAGEIEWYINEKFGKEYDDIYIVKDRHSGEEEVVWFDHGVSEDLSYIVLHHLMGEDMNYPIGLDEISLEQWKEWLNSYDRPEQRCSCQRGCRKCLGTEY